jgi:hypothetical protein
VLIEDKASGTQLIQELVAEGLHAVTRYQPQADKVMRMYAQTAVPGLDPGIENGFVHVPDTAPWLAQYLHELTTFNGRYDDQVDSTAQMLDWFKRGAGPASNAEFSNFTDSAPRRIVGGRRRAIASDSVPRAASRRSSSFPASAAPSPPTAPST